MTVRNREERDPSAPKPCKGYSVAFVTARLWRGFSLGQDRGRDSRTLRNRWDTALSHR